MNEYVLILSDPENSCNTILTQFECHREDLIENMLEYVDYENNFEHRYFNLVDIFLIDEVKEIFSQNFISIVENQDEDYKYEIQTEFNSKLKQIYEIIDSTSTQGLVDFFDGQKIDNKILFLIEDKCGVFKKLENNQFVF